ncbi:E3 ubiquitin-protein ligase RGLG2 [Ananas comosus]|uniref:E3 ubiquitin-protein ligase RGLG2 n=1 Tax=Ananas comosus TaxID=4615 RepID=A0A199W566_ANACO|nr:E3 ubiquitin-protein ligase RGLG2 [Ananas comosus]
MGGSSSRDSSGRRSFRDRSGYPPAVPGYSSYPPPQSPQPPPPEQHSYAAPYPAYSSQPSGYPQPQHSSAGVRRLDRRYSRINDDFNSVEQVTDALAHAGLESSNLIVGIDFTKSNEWTGKHSFRGRSLHHIGDTPNPYEQAISIIGRTLSKFDEDNLIPCFGFGDGISYFLRNSGAQYHVLLIIADGQVTRSVDTEYGQLSSQEQNTVDAIVKASQFPLSIVLVGVGDGPWDMMKEFDDNIPARAFDNFQFVNFTEIMSRNIPQTRKEAAFALGALMEIPSQYKATLELGILGRTVAKSPERVPLPPPTGSSGAYSSGTKSFKSSSFQQSTTTYPGYDSTPSAAPSVPSTSWDSQTCCDCGYSLQSCPICRSEIHTRIKLY